MSGDDVNNVCNKVNDELVKLSQYIKANQLSLNINKSRCMVFSNGKERQNVRIQIDGLDLEHVRCI